MKKVSLKLRVLANRIQTIQKYLDDIIPELEELEEQKSKFEDSGELTKKEELKYNAIVDDMKFIDEVYNVIDVAISDIENHIV